MEPLSGTLFNIASCSLANVIDQNISFTSYIDDFLFYTSHKNICILEQRMNINLIKIANWCSENGFSISFDKSSSIVFNNKKPVDVNIKMNNINIKNVTEFKHLGIILDFNLKWTQHIKYTKQKALKSLNTMKILSSKFHGVNRDVHRKIYLAYTQSILDYGSIFFMNADKKILSHLNTIHHMGIRLISRALKSSPVQSLYAESGIHPLDIRRRLLFSNFISNISADPKNPLYNLILNNYNLNKFDPDFNNEAFLKNQPLIVYYQNPKLQSCLHFT
uniref:Reverse transcriptase domain-containing protein n=1 Tax=Cacopsylla melanoneura TaxID=428564 RepID=A0A8D8R0Q9_9HEMI